MKSGVLVSVESLGVVFQPAAPLTANVETKTKTSRSNLLQVTFLDYVNVANTWIGWARFWLPISGCDDWLQSSISINIKKSHVIGKKIQEHTLTILRMPVDLPSSSQARCPLWSMKRWPGSQRPLCQLSLRYQKVSTIRHFYKHKLIGKWKKNLSSSLDSPGTPPSQSSWPTTW